MKYCSTCGQAHATHDQYCGVDGTALDKQARPIRFEQAAHFCIGCGNQMDDRSSYCPNCGHSRLVAATSEESLVDRLPGMGDIRKKWKTQEWSGALLQKGQGKSFLSRFESSIMNPNLLVGSVTALVFFATLASLLLVLLGVMNDSGPLNQLKEIQQEVGSEFSSIGFFFFLVFVSLSGLQLSSSEEIKAWFTTQATQEDVPFLSEIQRIMEQADFHIYSGHLLLSLPGLVLIIGSAWLLERGGIVGTKATSWSERIERSLAFALTLSVITLLAGVFATDFGLFNIHIFNGVVRSFVLIFLLMLTFILMSKANLSGRIEVARLSLGLLMSIYLACLILSSLGQVMYLQKTGELNQNPQEVLGIVLLSGSSPLYMTVQGGRVDLKLTMLTEEYRLGAALYGEDRINDLERAATQAGNASDYNRIQEIFGNQIRNGDNPTLTPKITKFDETFDLSLISHVMKLSDNPYKFEEEKLLRTKVFPYGLIVLLAMFLGHIWIGFKEIRSLKSVFLYAIVFVVGGVLLAYFTQTSAEVSWNDDVIVGVSISALTIWNAFILFIIPLLGSSVGYGIYRLKTVQE